MDNTESTSEHLQKSPSEPAAAASAPEERPVSKHPFSQQQYGRLLETLRVLLLKSGAGQSLAFLDSRTSPEGIELAAEMSRLIAAKLELGDRKPLDELVKRSSAFHRKLSAAAREAAAELREAHQQKVGS